MYCSKCGNEMNEGEGFCPKCGNSIQAEQPKSNTHEDNSSNSEPKNGIVSNYIKENNIKNPMSLIAFISSILGLLILPYLFGPISIILGILALQQKNIDKKSKTQAIIAIVLGVADLILPSFVQGFIQGFNATYYRY